MVLTKLKNIFNKLFLRTNNSILGLLITDRTIVVSEIECANRSYRLIRSAEYISSADNILSDLSSCTVDFGAFLKANDFKGHRAVVGIQAKYLLTAIIDLPAVKDKSMITNIIKISFAKKLKMDLSDVSFDYYIANNDSAVVLATSHKHINSIKTFLGKLVIAPLYVTGIASFIALDGNKDNVFYIIVFGDHVEMAAIDGDTIKGIKHISSIDDTDKITSAIKRDIALISDVSPKSELRIFDCSDHKHDIADRLQTGLREDGRFAIIKCNREIALSELAGSLAGKTVCNGNSRLNLLRSHTEENGQNLSYHKIAPKIAIGFMALLIVAGFFVITWYLNKAATRKLQSQLSSISSEAAEAKDIIDKVGYAKQWFDTNPRYIEVLRQLTMAFPESENIWLSTMAIDDSFNQVITGKATEEKSVLDLLDNLKKNSVFEGVKILYMRKAGKNTEIITFAMSFKINKG